MGRAANPRVVLDALGCFDAVQLIDFHDFLIGDIHDIDAVMIRQGRQHLHDLRPFLVFDGGQGGIVFLVRAALADAGMAASEVDYVSAHATGTRVGDQAEAAAIRGVFGGAVPVSSLKGHLGHTLGASGALELAAVAGMMRDGIVLPTRNLERVEDCSGILLPREIMERKVRVCLKNSIAFGGVNTALVCRTMD